jgi:hypothetical protein
MGEMGEMGELGEMGEMGEMGEVRELGEVREKKLLHLPSSYELRLPYLLHLLRLTATWYQRMSEKC